MSLMQLLAVGKSIRTIEDRPTPYKMKQQNLLPKFGRHPVERTAADAEESGDSAPSDQVHSQAKREGTSEDSKTVGGMSHSPYPKGRWTAWRRDSGDKRTTAVQGELALESLKVVRNDLRDADLEIVPRKARLEEEASGRQQRGPDAEAMIWSRIVMRIFGAGRP